VPVLGVKLKGGTSFGDDSKINVLFYEGGGKLVPGDFKGPKKRNVSTLDTE